MEDVEITVREATAMLTVSVAMCTFNGARFLREQLESLRHQEYPISELIVFDDNSTDLTRLVLTDFMKDCDFPVRVHVNVENLGVVRNFELAIACCSGDLIALADQDDIWLPNKLAVIVAEFLRAPLCGYAFSDAELIDERGGFLGLTLWRSVGFDARRQRNYSDGRQLQTMLRGGNFIYGTTLVFRSKFRSEFLPILSKSLACTHDTWIGMYLSATGHYGVAISGPLVLYRQHASQLFGGGKRLNAVEKFWSMFSARPDIDETYSDALVAIAQRVRSSQLPSAGTESAVFELTQMALHLRARYLAATCGRISRLKIILNEISSRRYFEYSSSSLSIIKDLLLPARRAAKDIGGADQ